jgi:4-amino-4-deoxy-L-arabinose transferase-like glycosyltransferase
MASAWDGRQTGYQYLLGLLFHFTGSEGRMPAAVLNCFFGALIVLYSYRIARSLFSEWVAIRVSWAACFFPALIIWSSQTLKEPVVILLEAIALYCCIQLKQKGFVVKYAVWCGLAIVLIVPFRFYAAYISAAAVVLTLIVPQVRKLRLSWGSMVAVAALVVPIIWFSGVLAVHQVQFENFNARRVQSFRSAISSGDGGGSGVRSDYNLQNPIELAQALAVGAAHVLLAPFPWQLSFRSMRLIGTTPELIVWWWLFFVGVIPGAWYLLRHRFGDIQPLLYFVLGLGALYSLMFGNVGLAYRHRAQLLPFLLMLGMVGLERRRLKKLAGRRHPLRPHWSPGPG